MTMTAQEILDALMVEPTVTTRAYRQQRSELVRQAAILLLRESIANKALLDLARQELEDIKKKVK